MKLAVGENASFYECSEFSATARLEYLQDRRGIYGLSIPILTYEGLNAVTYILRPDRLDEGLHTKGVEVSGAALQILPRRIFWRSHYIERQFTKALADAMHARSGLVGKPRRPMRAPLGRRLWT